MGIGAGAASIAATAASGIAGAAGSIMSGSAQAQAANYNAQVARNNATLSAQQAGVTLAQGQVAQQQQFQIGAAKMGALRAAYGANNIETDSGTAVNAQTSLAQTTGQDVANAGYNANVKAVGYLNQGANFQDQASLDMATASNDQTAGLFGAGTSLLGAASQVGSKWAWMQGGGSSGGTGMP